ncbi:MAG: dienelactone hydrolase family protein [Azospirillaceae bacterium]
MGRMLDLIAADGFRPSAYRADPATTPKGAVVVLQEIFGVNGHIRAVCDRLAGEGYVAVAPALFDRQVRGFESGYSEAEVAEARKFLGTIDWDAMLADTEAARVEAAGVKVAGTESAEKGLPAAVMGFCLGGSIAFLAATRQDGFAASICYYGGRIAGFADEVPRCPTQMHFGATDHSIPMADVETVQAKRPDCDIHVYDAGHGFNCDERGSYDAGSAALAWQRSMAWLDEHLR